MPLVFAGIAPHSPILIPVIGKQQTNKLDKTILALRRLAQELYIRKPDIIIVLSPHASYFEDAFSINGHDNFDTSFEEFGDITTVEHYKGAPHLAALISHEAQKNTIPVTMVSDQTIDYGTAVTLHYLTKELKDIQVLPIGFSALEPKMHLTFGSILKETILQGNNRVAIIASGNLSHCVKDNAPAPYKKEGKEFDDNMISLLETRNTIGITQLDQNIVKNASECAYRSILILLGALQQMDYQFENFSYEAPLGVGYLVGNFKM